MASKEEFVKTINDGYLTKGDFITIGAGVFENNVESSALIKAPLKTFNRHGLVAGATGTGKTKTLQGIAEKLSAKGVPVLLMDIKGDLSGIAKPGAENDKVKDRQSKVGIEWKASQYPVELLSLSSEKGVAIRIPGN